LAALTLTLGAAGALVGANDGAAAEACTDGGLSHPIKDQIVVQDANDGFVIGAAPSLGSVRRA
jgi:hypothetical protein